MKVFHEMLLGFFFTSLDSTSKPLQRLFMSWCVETAEPDVQHLSVVSHNTFLATIDRHFLEHTFTWLQLLPVAPPSHLSPFLVYSPGLEEEEHRK